ncbi:hypothetical protein ACVJF0_004730 [Bradyrhizobium elkanii]
MAQAAEQLLAPTDWLPSLLRTASPQGATDLQSEAKGSELRAEAAE